MLRKTVLSAILVFILLQMVLSGCTSLGVQPRNKAEVISKSGSEVTLLYDGSKVAGTVFCPGETAQVYRQESRERLRYIEVGKVKITRALDAHHLQAEIVEGEVIPGYFAGKGEDRCLVTAP